jgi:hypothetical protein
VDEAPSLAREARNSIHQVGLAIDFVRDIDQPWAMAVPVVGRGMLPAARG